MTSLFDIVETLHLESQQIDSIFRNKSRYMMVLYAKEGMKKLNLTFGLNVKGMNVQIPSSCKVFKPEGFERFVRAYLINCDGKTIELKRNNKIPNEIFKYMLTCDGTLLEDCDGKPLTTECLSCNETKKKEGCFDDNCDSCGGKGYYTLPHLSEALLDLIEFKDSWVKENAEFFEFSADLEGMNIIIEFVSNQTAGVDECSIRVDEKCALALEYYIKYRLLEGGEQTIQQAQYFYRMYKNAREAEKVKENAMTLNDIYSILTLK